MDRRWRLLTLLIAALCAAGWVPVRSASGPGDGATTGDGVGVLPGRRQSSAKLELEPDTDDPSCLPDVVESATVADATPVVDVEPRYRTPRIDRWWSAARSRGPPALA